ncbi:site-specific integrase [Paenisporosarcina sp. FSL H8-0542]|uniref:site-specific integrase n=1 Tax=Paenisporosarcina sp. FSL H8-0542 TaxID=2921401 RepID=UPI00315AFD45
MAHIRKRGKTYSYTIDIGIDPITGKRKQINKGGFIRKKDAEIAARKIELLNDENRLLVESKEIFSDFIGKWFENHYKKRIKESSVANCKYLIEKHILKENPFGHKEISNISAADIDAFYNLKLENGYSTSYIRKMHQLLNQAFNQAVKWKKLASNPVRDADPPSVRHQKMSIWSLNEINQFLQYCKDESHYLTFLLAIYTGMRRGEILGLKWSDIDYNKKTIYVNRSLVRVPKVGYLFTTPKTKHSIRQIPIPEFVLNELRTVKNGQEQWKQLVGELFQNQDLIICTHTGSFQDPRNVLRVMKRIIKSSGVSNIRFHDIRHTHASILISEGVDIVKISNRLGHTSPKTTLEFYAHLLPNRNNDIADIFHKAVQNEEY